MDDIEANRREKVVHGCLTVGGAAVLGSVLAAALAFGAGWALGRTLTKTEFALCAVGAVAVLIGFFPLLGWLDRRKRRRESERRPPRRLP